MREGELGKLNKLIQHIRIGSPEEVDRIITHIRSCDDSIEAYSSYFSSGDSLSRTTETETETWTTPGLRIDSQLDPVSEAWPALGNPVQVDALPWTDVAPDHVVSHLISQYFILERPILLPTIHFQSFIDEMNKGDAASGIYCSDLLVNAICAQQCVSTLLLVFFFSFQFGGIVPCPLFLSCGRISFSFLFASTNWSLCTQSSFYRKSILKGLSPAGTWDASS